MAFASEGPIGAFWKGADGQVYVKGADGTNSAGVWDANTQNYWASRGYEQIFDPAGYDASGVNGLLGGTTQSAPTNNTTGTTAKVFNQAAANNTQGTIDAIPGILQSLLGTEATKYQNTQNEFNTQEKTQKDQYDQSSTTNMQNYDGNMMDSVRAGVRGLSNLMGLLRGTGVEGQAKNLVGAQTAQDIRTGLDTRNENQTQVDTSLSSFLTELARKRKEADDTKVNNERALKREYDSQLQDLYGKMAGFYSDVNNTGEATNWMNRAGALTPSIAANSGVQVSPYDAAPVQVKAPEISAFAAPKDQAIGYSQGGGQLGSGIFSLGEQRRKKDALPVGA